MASTTSMLPPLTRTFSSRLRYYDNASDSPAVSQQADGNNRLRTQEVLSRSESRDDEETQRLLDGDNVNDPGDHADSDGLWPPHCCWTKDQDAPKESDMFGNAEFLVYENILRIRRDIINSMDDPYSLEQLRSPRINISVVRPLVDLLYSTQDLSIIYCLFVNRLQFMREQSYATHHQTVNLTRAILCELLAEKILRRYNEHNPGPRGLLKLGNILVAGFEPFQNAPEDVVRAIPHAMHWKTRKKTGDLEHEHKLTALELAIISESKSFLASSACQRVVDAIYRGKLVYTPNSFIDILPDHWKRRPISLYDPRRGPLLNQYRLIVPRIRNIIEVCQFVILLGLYVAVLAGRESRSNTEYTIVELVFDVYACGWTIDQVASVLEHGWHVYTQNLWSFLDVMFMGLFAVYFGLRIHSFVVLDEEQSILWARTGLDVLSCAAPILIPRLAFNVMSENMLFLSLRAMMSDFLTLTLLAVWSFAGFLLTLKWLHNGVHQAVTIGKWMIWIWFGLDGTGIQRSTDFHWLLGPVTMIIFAFLGNTLFLTILVSMLSNTFSLIVNNAVQEIQYRRAVLTFEGVKADAIFAYMPPFNILALVTLWPLKMLVSPRMFHKVNVSIVRMLNLPILLLISWYERRTLWQRDRFRIGFQGRIDWNNRIAPRSLRPTWFQKALACWDFSRFSVHGDIGAVFDIEPPEEVLESINEDPDEDRTSTSNLRDRLKYTDTSRTNERDQQKDSPNSSEAQPRSHSRPEVPQRVNFADESVPPPLLHHKSAPTGFHNLTRRGRLDSLAILDPSDGSHETNSRLQSLEGRMERIERLLERLVETAEGGDADEGEEGVEDLQEDLRRGVVK